MEWLLSTKTKENASSEGLWCPFVSILWWHMGLILRTVYEQRSKPLPMKIRLKRSKCSFYKTGDVWFPPQDFAEVSHHQAKWTSSTVIS